MNAIRDCCRGRDAVGALIYWLVLSFLGSFNWGSCFGLQVNLWLLNCLSLRLLSLLLIALIAEHAVNWLLIGLQYWFGCWNPIFRLLSEAHRSCLWYRLILYRLDSFGTSSLSKSLNHSIVMLQFLRVLEYKVRIVYIIRFLTQSLACIVQFTIQVISFLAKSVYVSILKSCPRLYYVYTLNLAIALISLTLRVEIRGILNTMS